MIEDIAILSDNILYFRTEYKPPLNSKNIDTLKSLVIPTSKKDIIVKGFISYSLLVELHKRLIYAKSITLDEDLKILPL